MADLCVAYILWLFCGIIGCHRCYVNQSGMGLLFCFTGGLFGIGWIVDCCLLPSLVEECNQRQAAVNVVNVQPTRQPAPQYSSQQVQRATPPQQNNAVQRYAAASTQGNVTTVGVVQVEREVGLQLDINAYAASILFDKSGSMAGRRDSAAVLGLAKIVSQFTDLDLMNCIAFNDKAWVVSDFQDSSGAQGRVNAINRLRQVRADGATALYDALALASLQLVQLWPLLHESNEGSRVKHRCLMIVLTDGEDTSSQVTLAQCTELITQIVRVTEGECRFIFIGVELEGKGRTNLEQLRRAGGNASEFYNSKDMDLDTIFDRIAASIRVTYNVSAAAVQIHH